MPEATRDAPSINVSTAAANGRFSNDESRHDVERAEQGAGYELAPAFELEGIDDLGRSATIIMTPTMETLATVAITLVPSARGGSRCEFMDEDDRITVAASTSDFVSRPRPVVG
jgi:hypothetical protein